MQTGTAVPLHARVECILRSIRIVHNDLCLKDGPRNAVLVIACEHAVYCSNTQYLL
jgi:hypothetical protein